MRRADEGMMLLTSHLSDPHSKPLTVAQFRTLFQRVQSAQRQPGDRELCREDLHALGYDTDFADRILQLLSRQELLEYYVNYGAKQSCYPLTRVSKGYPVRLRTGLGLDCPGCLWVKGDVALLDKPAISLVGSRNLMPENMLFAMEAGRQAARQGFVLISGNARGADQAAQNSCLENGGQVISIVADSLENCPLRRNVLYISEDMYHAEFSTARALSRNRLIHAMGLLTLVAQCDYQKGGTWNGTKQNLQKHYSPVLCYQDGSRAVQELISMGAQAVSSSDLKNLQNLIP